jgi:antitoxin ParD1/3/4
MNVSLAPQLEELVRQKVEAGLYSSAEEVVAEALWLLDQRDKKLAALRKDIEEGLNSGPSGPFDVERIIARGYERLAKQQRCD